MRRSSMRHSPLFAALLLALCATAAEARSVVATSNIIVRALDRSIDFTSDTTTSVRDMKVVTEARDDAASFVASDGAHSRRPAGSRDADPAQPSAGSP